MFGISGFKLLIILVGALVLLGPDKLPEIGRTIGKAIAMFKAAQADMQSVINAEMFTSDSERPAADGTGADASAEKQTVASQLYAVTDEDEEEEDEE